MDKKLQDKAEHTLNIEYPGRTLIDALAEARERSVDMALRMHELHDRLLDAQYQLDQATSDYHDAERACNLFENALNDQDEEK